MISLRISPTRRFRFRSDQGQFTEGFGRPNRASICASARLIVETWIDVPVFRSDEVDVHLNPKIGPDWMLSGPAERGQVQVVDVKTGRAAFTGRPGRSVLHA